MNFIINELVPPRALTDLPIGSSVECNGTAYVREVDGFYDLRNYVYARHQLLSISRPRLTGLGSIEVVETFEQYKQRLRTLTMGQAIGASVSLGPVTRALDELGITAPSVIRLGMWAQRNDTEMRRLMPTGTVAVTGRLDDWNTQGVYVMQGNEWVFTLGTRMQHLAAFQIVSVPDGIEVEEWPEPAEDEAERIAALKRQVDELGRKAKAANSWCGEYEAAVGRAGIDLYTLADAEAGALGLGGEGGLRDVATQEEFDALPPGSRVMCSHNPAYLYVKALDGLWLTVNETLARQYDEYVPRVGNERLNISDGYTYGVRFTPLQVEAGQPVRSVTELRQARIGSEVNHSDSRWVKFGEDNWGYVGLHRDTPIPYVGDASRTGTNVPSSGFGTPDSAYETGRTVWVVANPTPAPVVGERVASFAQMQVAPVGSTVRDDSGNAYTKAEEGHWTPTYGGRYEPHQFTIANLSWREVGSGSTEPAEPNARVIGEQVTQAAAEAAPIGVTVRRWNSANVRWTKEVNGWRGNNNEAIDTIEAVRFNECLWHDIEGFTTEPGAAIFSVEEANRAPWGTRVRARGGRIYVKINATTWKAADRDREAGAMNWRQGTYLLLTIGAETQRHLNTERIAELVAQQ